MYNKRKGTNLVELIGVMVVIGILLLFAGISVSKQTSRATRETCSNTLQIYANSLSEAYYDLGVFEYTSDLSKFKAWLDVVASDYMSVEFDMSTIEDSGGFIKVDTLTPLDNWEKPYHFIFSTDTSTMPYAIIASGGDNGELEDWGDAGLETNIGDDIVVIIHPKL